MKHIQSEYISSVAVSQFHGLTIRQQWDLIRSNKLTAYHRTQVTQQVSCNKNSVPLGSPGNPFPVVYLPIEKLEIEMFLTERPGEVFYVRSEFEAIAKSRPKKESRPQAPVPAEKRLTKVQQLVKDRVPEWERFCREKLKSSPAYPMARAIRSIQKQDIGRNPDNKDTPFSEDTIRKHVKHLFPGKPGRPLKK